MKTKQTKTSLPGYQGSSEKVHVKRKVLREVLNCGRELLCRIWGGPGSLFQTNGAWTENDLWPKPLSFHLIEERVFFSPELERRVRDGVYTERQGDRYGGRVPLNKRKAKEAILKSILSLPGSQWSFFRSSLTCSCLLLWKKNLAEWFWFFLETVHLIRGDVDEQNVAIVQATANEKTHQQSSGFPRQEIANRANFPDHKYAEQLL